MAFDNKEPQRHYSSRLQEENEGVLGVTGFVLALIGLLTTGVPIFGNIIWFLGFTFSIAGLFEPKKGYAFTGIIISLIGIILILVMMSMVIVIL